MGIIKKKYFKFVEFVDRCHDKYPTLTTFVVSFIYVAIIILLGITVLTVRRIF